MLIYVSPCVWYSADVYLNLLRLMLIHKYSVFVLLKLMWDSSIMREVWFFFTHAGSNKNWEVIKLFGSLGILVLETAFKQIFKQ